MLTLTRAAVAPALRFPPRGARANLGVGLLRLLPLAAAFSVGISPVADFDAVSSCSRIVRVLLLSARAASPECQALHAAVPFLILLSAVPLAIAICATLFFVSTPVLFSLITGIVCSVKVLKARVPIAV